MLLPTMPTDRVTMPRAIGAIARHIIAARAMRFIHHSIILAQSTGIVVTAMVTSRAMEPVTVDTARGITTTDRIVAASRCISATE